MHKRQNLKLGVLISYIWVVVHVGMSFVFIPILIQFLGNNEYGLYQVVASFLAYINILETSLSTGVLRYYCVAKAKGDSKIIENTLAICKEIYNKLSLAILAIGLLVAFAFQEFYVTSFSKSELREGTLMLLLLVFNLVITMKNALYLACIRGNERFVFEKSLSIASQALQPILCILILTKFPYALMVTFVQVFMNVLVSITRYYYAKKMLDICVERHYRDKKLEKMIIVFASGILLSNIADRIFWNTDQMILAKLYGTSVVAIYSIGSQIASNYMYVGTTIASVFFSRVSFYYENDKDIQRISDLFVKVGRIAFFLCFLVLSGFIVFGKEFLCLWVGKDYLPAYQIAIVIMIPFTIDVIQNLGLTILQVLNKYSFRAKMYFVAAVLNILLTVVFAWIWGGFGAALSTGITMFITSGIILNIYYQKMIGLDIIMFWKNIFGIFIRLFPLVLISFMLNNSFYTSPNLIAFMIKICLYSIFYMMFCYCFAVNDYEKNISAQLWRKILSLKCKNKGA